MFGSFCCEANAQHVARTCMIGFGWSKLVACVSVNFCCNMSKLNERVSLCPYQIWLDTRTGLMSYPFTKLMCCRGG